MRKNLWYIAILALLLLLTACTGLPGVTIGQATPVATDNGSHAQGTTEEQHLTQQLFRRINSDRAANDLPALAWEPRLVQSGRLHDLVMAGGCGLQHQCPGEPDVGTRISNQGMQWQAAGENIGEGGPVYTDSDAWNMVLMIHNGMMGEKPPDDGHRRNLLSRDFHRIGISIYIDAKNTLWVTEDFAS